MHKKISIAILAIIASASLSAMSLHEAVEKGDYHEVEKIVTTTFDSININKKDVKGKTALHLADNDIVDLLLAYGADPNIPDDDNMPPLLCAVGEYQDGKAQQLLCYGADPSLTDIRGENAAEKFKKYIELRTPSRLPQLEKMMSKTYDDLLDSLISFEAFYKKSTLPNKQNALTWSCFSNMIATTCRPNLIKQTMTIKEYQERGEDEYKKSFCSTFINEPGIIIKFIENDWYDETIIKKCYQYWDTEDNNFKDKPIVCDTILKALRKKERDKKLMGNYHHTNTHFAFE